MNCIMVPKNQKEVTDSFVHSFSLFSDRYQVLVCLLFAFIGRSFVVANVRPVLDVQGGRI